MKNHQETRSSSATRVGGEERTAFVRQSGPEAPSGVHFVQAAGRKQIWFKPGFPFVREGKVCFRAGEISPPIFSVINKLRNTKPLKTSQNDGATARAQDEGSDLGGALGGTYRWEEAPVKSQLFNHLTGWKLELEDQPRRSPFSQESINIW